MQLRNGSKNTSGHRRLCLRVWGGGGSGTGQWGGRGLRRRGVPVHEGPGGRGAGEKTGGVEGDDRQVECVVQ